MSSYEKTYNRNLLLAVDESENSRRAVLYVAQVLGGFKGFELTLLHVVQPPDEDFFPTREERDMHYRNHKENIRRTLEDYRRMLVEGGFSPADISIHVPERFCPSLAECILSEHSRLGSSTIVVGRKGVTRKEEFLFGSVSSRIVNNARNCTVWVVE